MAKGSKKAETRANGAPNSEIQETPPTVVEESAPSIELRDIDGLVPYSRNSRMHSDDQIGQIAASMDEFGMVGAIVVRDGVIAKGHGTLAGVMKLMAAGKRIYPPPGRAQGANPYPAGKVPVIDASGWTDGQFKAFVIADNRLALNAGWNYEMLAVELDELRDIEFDLALIGFDPKELNDLIGTPNDPPPGDGATNDDAARNLLMIECASEGELEELFNEMKERGLECKILS